MEKNVQHGNLAKVDAHKKMSSVYQTSTIVPNEVTSKKAVKSTKENPVSTVIPENAIFAKEFVDENHK